jgi:hypothetical protein
VPQRSWHATKKEYTRYSHNRCIGFRVRELEDWMSG